MNTLDFLTRSINKRCETRKKYLMKIFQREKKKFETLDRYFSIKKVDIIGSLAHNTHHPYSDLDINFRVTLGIMCFTKKLWLSYGRLFVGKFVDEYKDVKIQMILKGSTLLIACINPDDGLKIDLTVNNNKCVRNARFYKIFGEHEIFRNTARILKLFSRRNVGRKNNEEEKHMVFPGGFFFEMLVAQKMVDDNDVGIKTAFDIVTIETIKKPLDKNKYTTKKCLLSCVNYILELKRLDKLVFDYEECLYNYWSFHNMKDLEKFQEKFKDLKEMIVKDQFKTDLFLDKDLSRSD